MAVDISAPVRRRAAPAPADRYAQASPWQRSDAVGPGLLVVLGLAGAAVSWYGSSKKANYEDQTGWIFVGVFSAVLISIGIAVWLITGLRAVRGAQRELWAQARFVWDLPEIDASRPAAPVADVALVIGDRMTMYHRADCIVTRRKEVRPVSADEAAELEACRICRS